MANSIQRDIHGPDWPLGNIIVTVPGTPVNIMSLVDPSDTNEPDTPSSATTAEYTAQCQQLQFQAFKVGAGGHGLAPNTGNIYIVREGNLGAGNRDDPGSIVTVLQPGQTYFLASAPRNRNEFSPYRYFVDSDTAGDACQVTLLIG